LLQVLGAYGLRGLIERRPHFLSSIPHGLQNIATWLKLYNLNDYPILHSLLQIITHVNLIESYQIPQANGNTKLKVLVQSFSYKIGGIPKDESDNGGGFVFDCRGVLNPGRFEEYKKLTGRDAPVIEFLETKTKVHDFLQGVKQVIDISIEDYLQRGFDSLMISFGCTGGQHRSVYCADVIATYLQEKYHLQVEVKHVRQEEKAWVN
jgi:RNase adaptor protein for sRNA GlmZ degradation